MIKSSIKIIDEAEKLPDKWDKLAGIDYLMKREILKEVEKTNPCEQRYFIFCSQEADSIAVAYKLKLNIFTYSRLSLKLPVTMVSLPFSVCKKGYCLSGESKEEVFQFLKTIKGPKLVLNSEDLGSIKGYAKGVTLPTYKLDVSWSSFEDYIGQMRSHYKYRIMKALKKGEEIKVLEINPKEEFDESLYELYLNVYKASEYKLEKLSIEFFRSFPARIFKFQLSEKNVGFVQIQKYDREMMFLFGGFDYSLNRDYDIYINMLLHIVRVAIMDGCGSIDFGQTAEDTKQKLGCKSEKKYMYFHHSNRILNMIVGKAMSLLSYKEPDTTYMVFKEKRE